MYCEHFNMYIFSGSNYDLIFIQVVQQIHVHVKFIKYMFKQREKSQSVGNPLSFEDLHKFHHRSRQIVIWISFTCNNCLTTKFFCLEKQKEKTNFISISKSHQPLTCLQKVLKSGR